MRLKLKEVVRDIAWCSAPCGALTEAFCDVCDSSMNAQRGVVEGIGRLGALTLVWEQDRFDCPQPTRTMA
jgi:hypothetical protein